ncbi:MAG: DUF4097 family beta strand repeat-containing protein [Acetivibrionales bacterium]|jgi:lia operon protein LiaG
MFLNMSIKKIIVVTIILLVTALTLGIAVLSTITRSLINNSINTPDSLVVNSEKSFNSGGIKKINIRTVSENVNIIATNSPEISVAFYGDASNSHSAPKMSAVQLGNNIEIKVEHGKPYFNLFSFNRSFKLDIHIPQDYSESIEISAVSSDINISGIEPENLYCKTVSGNLTINSKCGSLNFSSVSGNLIAASLHTENTHFDTTSGKMKVESFTGNMEFSSVSGDVAVSYEKFDNDIYIKTTSGDARIKLPENSEFYLDFKSTSGNIESDFAVTVTESKRNSLKGTVGSNKNKITVKSVSGDMNLYMDSYK